VPGYEGASSLPLLFVTPCGALKQLDIRSTSTAEAKNSGWVSIWGGWQAASYWPLPEAKWSGVRWVGKECGLASVERPPLIGNRSPTFDSQLDTATVCVMRLSVWRYKRRQAWDQSNNPGSGLVWRAATERISRCRLTWIIC
jgi:hypothetical protein